MLKKNPTVKHGTPNVNIKDFEPNPKINLGKTQHVIDWVFDLDNTLYHHSHNLFRQVEILMTEYIMRHLQLDQNLALKLQKDYFHRYGTTLRGLMLHHQIDPADFLERVHDIDYSVLPVATKLRQELQTLKGKKYIFTNGNKSHAEKVLKQLGIPTTIFTDIVDIALVNYEPKPDPKSYQLFLSRHSNINPKTSAMLDDIAVNLIVPKQLGMTTILIHDNNSKLIPELEPPNRKHIDITTHDICDLLTLMKQL